MIDVLLAGRLRGAPTLRTTTKGTPFATFRLAASDKNGESLLCSCVTFSASTVEAVQRLADGDSIAASGECALTEWSGKDGKNRLGLDVTVHAVLTAYHAGRKRPSAEPKPSDHFEPQ